MHSNHCPCYLQEGGILHLVEIRQVKGGKEPNKVLQGQVTQAQRCDRVGLTVDESCLTCDSAYQRLPILSQATWGRSYAED